ncbi:MAG: phospho-sugar mutase, partial [Carbonactinosporaceae bacterium]
MADDTGRADLLDRARAWLAEDPDPQTRAELAALLDGNDLGGIADRFGGRLEFGTAGLRGALGAGPNRMNRALVTRAAAGLAAYLRNGAAGPVVVGHDARHNSAVFAHDTAAVMAGAGRRALLLPLPLPTPVLAFAARRLGCVAGVMVTASHNPPQDNGYKVYLDDGRQIVPPADAAISAEIDRVGPLAGVARDEDAPQVLDDSVVHDYLARVSGVVAPGGPRELEVVYTPLHGVAGDVLLRAFERAGFARPHVVPEQAEPDPDFPSVAFPNPEEPGALDLALAAAQRRDADLVLANDPDGDRCAVAVPAGRGWRLLSGDEVGALLALHLVRRGASGTFATTVVSSSLLKAMARAHGLGYTETLTGFKWLSRVRGLRFAYEEALGYCVDPEAVRDKDGVSAALLVAELAASLRAGGRTLTDLLDEIAREFGVHATEQLSVRVTSSAGAPARGVGDPAGAGDAIADAMARLRSDPPGKLGGLAVHAVEDMSAGVGGLPPAEGLRLWLTGGARVVVRPSGTEPKLKSYLEVVVPAAGGDVAGARAEAAERLGAQVTSELADLAM